MKRIMFEVEEYKVWKGLDPEKPQWSGIGIVTEDWDHANGFVDDLTKLGRIMRVGKSKFQIGA